MQAMAEEVTRSLSAAFDGNPDALRAAVIARDQDRLMAAAKRAALTVEDLAGELGTQLVYEAMRRLGVIARS